jgi:biopolymer transport protein ExbD
MRRRRRIEVQPINLAPLIDVNANLLFFLLVANSVQEDRLQAGKDVELPVTSATTAEAGDLISVVVSMDGISVNERAVIPLLGGAIDPQYLDAQRDDRITALHALLGQRFQDVLQKGAQPGAAGDDSKVPIVFIQGDKRLPYATLSKVMRTCGEVGFTKFRFAAKAG